MAEVMAKIMARDGFYFGNKVFDRFGRQTLARNEAGPPIFGF